MKYVKSVLLDQLDEAAKMHKKVAKELEDARWKQFEGWRDGEFVPYAAKIKGLSRSEWLKLSHSNLRQPMAPILPEGRRPTLLVTSLNYLRTRINSMVEKDGVVDIPSGDSFWRELEDLSSEDLVRGRF